jgi:hypothetical protein
MTHSSDSPENPLSLDQKVKAVSDMIERILESEPVYRDAWQVFETHHWQDRLTEDCLRRVDDIVDEYASNPEEDIRKKFSRAILFGMKDNVLDCIEAVATSRPGKSVAFFSPTKAFASNFGGVAEELEKRGCQVLYFYGYVGALQGRQAENEFIIFDDMLHRVRGIDAFVTASIMDALPDTSQKILIDHLSFAKFDVDHYIDVLRNGDIADDSLNSRETVFGAFSAYLAFLPLVDLHIAPTNFIADNIDNILHALGYHEPGEKTGTRAKNADFIWRSLEGKPVSPVSTVVVGGYPKLDAVVERAADVEAENLIVYAPTPNDKSGNKSGDEWADFISVNEHGAALVVRLCEAFPDHKIVFKPHVDDFEEVIERVTEAGSAYDNFELSMTGSDYWDLYIRAKLLISDFSSTAYTFAFGTGHPVVFFSPNEHLLGDRLENNIYCRHRGEIGDIACDLDALTEAVGRIIDDHEGYCDRVRRFRETHFTHVGNASRYIADEIEAVIEGETRPDWKRYIAPELITTSSSAGE